MKEFVVPVKLLNLFSNLEKIPTIQQAVLIDVVTVSQFTTSPTI